MRQVALATRLIPPLLVLLVVARLRRRRPPALLVLLLLVVLLLWGIALMLLLVALLAPSALLLVLLAGSLVPAVLLLLLVVLAPPAEDLEELEDEVEDRAHGRASLKLGDELSGDGEAVRRRRDQGGVVTCRSRTRRTRQRPRDLVVVEARSLVCAVGASRDPEAVAQTCGDGRDTTLTTFALLTYGSSWTS